MTDHNEYPADLIPDIFGGVRLIAIMDDGESLCETCVRDQTNPVHRGGDGDGWRIEGWTTTGDLEEPDHCAHCNKTIE